MKQIKPSTPIKARNNEWFTLPQRFIHGCIQQLTIVIALLITPLAQALSVDINQSVQITADSAIFDRKKGTATYRGNVILTQGSLQVWADNLLIQSLANRVATATATGNPARYKQQLEGESEPAVATGQTIIFNAVDNQLIIRDEAVLQHMGNRFSGAQIIYDISSETVQASGNTMQKGESTSATSSKERVRMIIQPPARVDQTNNNTPNQNNGATTTESTISNTQGNTPQ